MEENRLKIKVDISEVKREIDILLQVAFKLKKALTECKQLSKEILVAKKKK